MLSELIWKWRTRLALRRRIAEELQYHLDEAAAGNVAAGMSVAEARRDALVRFGKPTAILGECLSIATEDLGGFPAPSLRIPAGVYAAVGLLLPPMLAFVLIPHYLFEPPGEDPVGLAISPKRVNGGFELVDNDRERAAGFRRAAAQVGPPGWKARAYSGQIVSANFFELQGVAPALGNGFSSVESAEVVLSHELWRAAFGSDPSVVGRDAEVNGEIYSVVGVAPKGYWFLNRADRFWLRAFDYRYRGIGSSLLVRTAAGEYVYARLDGSEKTIELTNLVDASRAPLRGAGGIVIGAMALLAAVGLLQAWTMVRTLGDERVPSWILARNYLFLLAKALPALLVAAVFWLAAYPLSSSGIFAGVWSVLSTFVFALSATAIVWQSLLDQRLRCPTCLRKLSMPLPLGVIGSVLFQLPGTEYICAYGHGTLYLPSPTSEGLREPRWRAPSGLWGELLGSSAPSRS